ncbi:MAG: class II aldolase/adducin family protein [Polyangia bacterium]
MKKTASRWVDKLVEAGLAEAGEPLLGVRQDGIRSSGDARRRELLRRLLDELGDTAVLIARPAEPYGSIVDFLARRAKGVVRPQDSETQVLLGDLPVAPRPTAENLLPRLAERSCAIAPGGIVIARGQQSAEQAFIAFSSVCFACYVKLFSDRLADLRDGRSDSEAREVVAAAIEIDAPPGTEDASAPETLRDIPAPYRSVDEVHRALSEIGRRTVTSGLVGAYFGNVSYRLGDTLYISRSRSSLDELEGRIVPCPLDEAGSAPPTASRELPAHLRIVKSTKKRAVLHGHPRYAVIASLARDSDQSSDACSVRGVPIVRGEIGGGPRGLARTVPPALESSPAAIVRGHGVFATGAESLVEAFDSLLETELECRAEVLDELGLRPPR